MVSVMTSIWLGDGNAHDDELPHHYLAGLIDDVDNNDKKSGHDTPATGRGAW